VFRKSRALCRGVALAALAGLLLPGCASEETFEEEPVKAHLRQICKSYFTHMDFHRRPPTADQMRSVVDDLHRLDMGAPADEALVSPRDKQPFVIIYGADVSEPPTSILAYEQQGADDSRWVLYMNGEIALLPEAEFSKATFAHNHTPGKT
jgi:hypothetical protein